MRTVACCDYCGGRRISLGVSRPAVLLFLEIGSVQTCHASTQRFYVSPDFFAFFMAVIFAFLVAG